MKLDRDIRRGGAAVMSLASTYRRMKAALISLALFRLAVRMIMLLAMLATLYWLFVASNRYVSEATVIIQKADSVDNLAPDIPSMLSGVAGAGGPNRSEQLLLREYLLSEDMLKKLDAALDLRSHYSNARHDIVSRMWFNDAPIEWFYLYYLSRVTVDYDDLAGVLRIKVQAYDPKTAQAIANMLVQEGERYMNQIGHELADVQVSFLTTQADLAQQRFQEAMQALLAYQNEKGLVSPQSAVDLINANITKLEAQRLDIQGQLASLPTALNRTQPNVLRLRQSLAEVERQIVAERDKLTSSDGNKLNYTIGEFERLQMDVNFTQDLYKTALLGLEKGRMDATRTLEKVSVLQAPTHPEFPTEPRRIYNIIITVLFAAIISGILKLLESIIRDHID